MVNKTPLIDLYKGRGKSFFDKFIKWALNLGRLVVVLTEVIALSAFLYRFSLDRQLIDLHDKIKQKQAIIKYLKPTEDKYRNFQDRLFFSSTLKDSGKETVKIYQDLNSITPKDLTYNNLAISNDYIRLEANANSASSLLNLINALKKQPKVTKISLDKIENRTSNATINASIRITLKN